MGLRELGLSGLAIVPVKRFEDARGSFSELFRQNELEKLGISAGFVQDNLSYSASAGTLRGLHAQRAPMAQAKLVTVISGVIFDVVVDCRKDSSSFGQHRTVVLSAKEPALLYVPRGYCHGFLTLEPQTTVLYKLDNYYSPAHETGLHWTDPDLSIAWPLEGRAPIISEKDRVLPFLANLSAL
jgi:dTDP-4-dehydrorhamnose 3,5-epimerase